MKNLPMNPLNPGARHKARGADAFTLSELLVVVCTASMLMLVLLSTAFTTRERAMRAECVNNLREIGVGLNLYATDANDYFPLCGWVNPTSGGNPWQTYLAARMLGTGTNIIQGYYNLGLLFRTGIVPNPKTFYCPSTSAINSVFSYGYYTTASNSWPFAPNDGQNPYIRTGYNYYPQLRVIERLVTAFGPFNVPKLTASQVQLEFGEQPLSLVTPARWTDLDPKKSVTTDLVNSTGMLSHRATGTVAGLNALFPDGRVVFQNQRTASTTVNSPWFWAFWNYIPSGPADDPGTFRIIMSKWNQ